MEQPVIQVTQLSKKYPMGRTLSPEKKGLLTTLAYPFKMLRRRGDSWFSENESEFWALKDITFQVCHGEKLGIIGRNGAGKSTLLKILSRLVYPTEGEARIRGRVTSLLEVGTGFNPNLTGRENIYLNASLHGLSKAEINQKYAEIVEFSGVGKFINSPVKHYSNGMYSRLAFSVAAHIDPDILMLDEVLSVGDMAFQQKCLQKVEGLATGGRTILFVSHSMDSIIRFCDRVLWLEDGRIVQYGGAKEVVAAYSSRMLKLRSSYTPPSLPVKPAAVTDPEHPEASAAELLGFDITAQDNSPKELFFRHEPLKCRIQFKVLRNHVPLVVNIHLFKDNTHVLTSNSNKFTDLTTGSLCTVVMTIPAELLNTGDYSFSIAIVTPSRPIKRHVKAEKILTIRILESYNPDKIFSGDQPGLLLMKFPWEAHFQNP